MNIEEFRDYCLSLGGVAEKTPFGKFARRFDSILVFYVMGHMFCMTDMDDFSAVSVKSTPEEADRLLQQYASVGPCFNRTMKDWLELRLNGDLPDREIYALVRRAYEIVRAKYTPKSRRRTPPTQ